MFAFPYLPHRFLWTPDEFIAAQPEAQRPFSVRAERERDAGLPIHALRDKAPAFLTSDASRAR